MHPTRMSLALALFAAALATGCASTAGSGKATAATATTTAQPQPSPTVDLQPEIAAKPAEQRNSPLVRPGQDPAIAGPGADIKARPPGFEPIDRSLEERVEQRWKLLMAGKGDAAYDFLTAGVRSTVKRSQYAADMGSRPIRWIAADALDGKCEGTSCNVRVLMTYRFTMQSTGAKEMQSQSAITERWLKVGDEWHHLPEQYLEGFIK